MTDHSFRLTCLNLRSIYSFFVLSRYIWTKWGVRLPWREEHCAWSLEERKWFERVPCVLIKELFCVFLSPLLLTTKSFGSLFMLPSNPSFNPGKQTCSRPRDLWLSSLWPHLVCAQIYLSSEKGSNQLASSRIVCPSLWFCLTSPGTATSRALEAPSKACPWGGEPAYY